MKKHKYIIHSSRFRSFLIIFIRLSLLSVLLLFPAVTIANTLTPAIAHQDEPIRPLTDYSSLNTDKVKLGRSLFFDPRLSRDNTISCASCHFLKEGGTDNQAFSIGINKAKGQINSPTVYNSQLNIAQFWDGRSHTLKEQVNGPVMNPIEMGNNWSNVITILSKDKVFLKQFKQSYSDGINAANISDAIAEFEKSLTTINSPFDQYLAGDNEAISSAAQKGYQLFKSYGCTACHQGANVGGNMYQKMGIMADYFADRGGVINQSDLGRYNVTKDEYDKHTFKVPSLRLVVLTYPYFHDGSVQDMETAINKMAKYQLGREIPKQDIQYIIVFLHSLLGEHKELSPQAEINY